MNHQKNYRSAPFYFSRLDAGPLCSREYEMWKALVRAAQLANQSHHVCMYVPSEGSDPTQGTRTCTIEYVQHTTIAQRLKQLRLNDPESAVHHHYC